MPAISELLNALAFTECALGWATGGRCEDVEQGRLTHAQLTQAGQGVLEFAVHVGQDEGMQSISRVHRSLTEER